MSLLSRALASASSSSLQESSVTSSTAALAAAACAADQLQCEQLDTPKSDDEFAGAAWEGTDDELEPHWAGEHHEQPPPAAQASYSSLDDLCRAMASMSQRTSSTTTAAMACGGRGPSAPAAAALRPVAQSCPKPIAAPRGGSAACVRAAGHHHLQDELSVFVPPHELAACSWLDPGSGVAGSLCRKGSAAIRQRAGVLRRTGFLEGQTEVMRPAGCGAGGGVGAAAVLKQ